jgi:putative ABC transport system ATP-binding protein
LTEAAVQLADLRFAWPGQAQPCVDIAAFDVAPAESVFLHGDSGSGKSTLLALLGGVLVPQTGSVRVLGTELTRLAAGARDRFRVDHTGFVFQQFNLIPYLSMQENVLLPCRFSARRRQRALDRSPTLARECQRLLGELDLDRSLWRRPVTQVSVGQQQRVAAARALIGAPELVIADEPTSALDATRQAAFLDLLARECKRAGATLIFVSHDRRLAAHCARSVALADLQRAGAPP